MPTYTFLLLTLLLVAAGSTLAWLYLRRQPPMERKPRLALILLGSGITLLLLHFSLEPAWTRHLNQPRWAALHLLAPFILGFFSFLVSRLFNGYKRATATSLSPAELLSNALPWLALAVLLLLVGFFLQPYGVMISLLPGIILLVVLWYLDRSGDAWRVLLSLVLLVLLGLVSSGMGEMMYPVLPAWVSMLLRPLVFILAGLVVLLAAMYAYQGVSVLSALKTQSAQSSFSIEHSAAPLHLGLAGALLLVLLVTVFWVSVWDLTADSLGGIWFVITGGLGGIAAGGFLIERFRKQVRILGVVFLLLVPALIGGAFSLGIDYPHLDRTSQRAEVMRRSIEAYHNQNYTYPPNLEALVPANMLWVPRQLILQGEDWCYQGGEDYFRLGAFWRLSFSNLLMIEEYGRHGNPPDTGWVCLEDLDRMKWKYDPSPFFDAGQ